MAAQMTTVELARLAKRARDLQREYFRGRSPAKLEESKAAERELDRAVDAVLHPKAPPQPGLFDEAPAARAAHEAALCDDSLAWCPACCCRCIVFHMRCRGCGAPVEPLNGR